MGQELLLSQPHVWDLSLTPNRNAWTDLVLALPRAVPA